MRGPDREGCLFSTSRRADNGCYQEDRRFEVEGQNEGGAECQGLRLRGGQGGALWRANGAASRGCVRCGAAKSACRTWSPASASTSDAPISHPVRARFG